MCNVPYDVSNFCSNTGYRYYVRCDFLVGPGPSLKYRRQKYSTSFLISLDALTSTPHWVEFTVTTSNAVYER